MRTPAPNGIVASVRTGTPTAGDLRVVLDLSRAEDKVLFAACYDEPAIIICWKDIYEKMEDAIDSCERAASILAYLSSRPGCRGTVFNVQVLDNPDPTTNSTGPASADEAVGRWFADAQASGRFTEGGQQYVNGIPISNSSDILQSNYGIGIGYTASRKATSVWQTPTATTRTRTSFGRSSSSSRSSTRRARANRSRSSSRASSSPIRQIGPGCR